MSEEKLGVVRCKLGATDYDLFFTPQRVVVAKTGNSLMWAALLGAIGQAIAAHMSKKRSEQLRDLTIESILSADRQNFHIAYEDVVRAQVKKPGGLMAGKLTIDTGAKAHKFILADKKMFVDDHDVVQRCLGSKLVLL